MGKHRKVANLNRWKAFHGIRSSSAASPHEYEENKRVHNKFLAEVQEQMENYEED